MADENKSILSLVNGEGALITLQREHTMFDQIATMTVVGTRGETVPIKLNKENRYRLIKMLEVIGY